MTQKRYTAAQKKNPEDKLNELTDKLEAGIKEVFSSQKYKDYLKVMSRFHGYSYNNTMLILLQKPDARLLAGYKTWQGMERNVKKGEHGISILAPSKKRFTKYMDKIDKDTRKPVLDQDGNPVKVPKEIEYLTFYSTTIFDISQTEGKPLPVMAEELNGQVTDYGIIMDSLKETAPAPIRFESWEESKKGYFSPLLNEIVIKSGMSELQTVKTGIHETAHSILHSGTNNLKDSATMETEAESIAFIVCCHLGLDTSSYSFPYLATWSSSKELPELKSSLSTIQKTAHSLIEKLDQAISKRIREHSIEEQEISRDTGNPDISLETVHQEPEIPALPDTHRRRR